MGCTKCSNKFIHKPASNKDAKEHNDGAQKFWDVLNAYLKEWKDGNRGDPPVDANQKPLTRIPLLKLMNEMNELIVCKCH